MNLQVNQQQLFLNFIVDTTNACVGNGSENAGTFLAVWLRGDRRIFAFKDVVFLELFNHEAGNTKPETTLGADKFNQVVIDSKTFNNLHKNTYFQNYGKNADKKIMVEAHEGQIKGSLLKSWTKLVRQ